MQKPFVKQVVLCERDFSKSVQMRSLIKNFAHSEARKHLLHKWFFTFEGWATKFSHFVPNVRSVLSCSLYNRTLCCQTSTDLPRGALGIKIKKTTSLSIGWEHIRKEDQFQKEICLFSESLRRWRFFLSFFLSMPLLLGHFPGHHYKCCIFQQASNCVPFLYSARITSTSGCLFFSCQRHF